MRVICARRDDGEVLCWGDHSVGQLGLANTDNIGDDELPSPTTRPRPRSTLCRYSERYTASGSNTFR